MRFLDMAVSCIKVVLKKFHCYIVRALRRFFSRLVAHIFKHDFRFLENRASVGTSAPEASIQTGW